MPNNAPPSEARDQRIVDLAVRVMTIVRSGPGIAGQIVRSRTEEVYDLLAAAIDDAARAALERAAIVADRKQREAHDARLMAAQGGDVQGESRWWSHANMAGTIAEEIRSIRAIPPRPGAQKGEAGR
jgi:hypothetical protein